MMPGQKQFGYFRSEGGSVFKFDLPLREVFAEQVAQGRLVEVAEDGKPLPDGSPKGSGSNGGSPDNGDGDGDRLPEREVVEKPKPGDSKAKWVTYAVSQGMTEEEAESVTRNDLAALYGEKPEGEN